MALRAHRGGRRPLLGLPVGRFDAASALRTDRNTGHRNAFSVVPRPLVLGRRAVRSAQRSRQQLSDGAGRFSLPGPDSPSEYSPDPDRRAVGGGGRRRVRGGIEDVLRRRRARSGPAVVRRDAAWDRRKRAHRLFVPRTAGVAGEAAVGGRDDRRRRPASHHADLPGARQRSRCGVPGDGSRKRDVVARARAGDRALPAAMVCPIGRLHRFTDHAASPGGT
jgi:hypothetical protein